MIKPTADFSTVLRQLNAFFYDGIRLVAYATNERSAATVRHWFKGEIEPSEAQKEQLSILHACIQELLWYDGRKTILAMLIGMNPYLGDQSPLEVLREGNTLEFIGAVKQFIANG